MRRIFLFVCLCLLLPVYAWSVSDNKAKQIADINFENGTASDNLGNVIVEALNGASVVSDDIRQGKVLSFDADLKGCLQLKGDILSDEMTISFFGKREDIDPNANWRMFLALYADDGSNIYLTPKTSWGNDSYIVIDNKPYICNTSKGVRTYVRWKILGRNVFPFYDICGIIHSYCCSGEYYCMQYGSFWMEP